MVPCCPLFFWGEGSPTKIDYRKKWYPYSNLSNLDDLVNSYAPVRSLSVCCPPGPLASPKARGTTSTWPSAAGWCPPSGARRPASRRRPKAIERSTGEPPGGPKRAVAQISWRHSPRHMRRSGVKSDFTHVCRGVTVEAVTGEDLARLVVKGFTPKGGAIC